MISDAAIRTSTPKTKRLEQNVTKETKGTQPRCTPRDRTGKEYSAAKPRTQWREDKEDLGRFIAPEQGGVDYFES